VRVQVKLRRSVTAALAVAVIATTVIAPTGAQGADNGWHAYENGDLNNNTWSNSKLGGYFPNRISANRGRFGGTSITATFRMQTVDTQVSHLYNWGEVGQQQNLNYGFTQLSSGHVKSQCRWTSPYAIPPTFYALETSCSFYGWYPNLYPVRGVADEATGTDDSSDEIPVFADEGDQDPGALLNLELLAQSTNAEFYSATDSEGNICIFEQIVGGDLWGSSCTDPETFAEDGVRLALGGPDPDTALANAVLVPFTDDETASSRGPVTRGSIVILSNDMTEDTTVSGMDGWQIVIPGSSK
jgi:hypothetical protein